MREPYGGGLQCKTETVMMTPTAYSESISVGEIPAYTEDSCVAFCDYEPPKRCKEGVKFGPGLCPVAYRDSIICYKDCTKKRFVSRVEYQTRMKPRGFSETFYVYPKRLERSYVAFMDYHSDSTRKWYKSTVEMKPKTFSSTAMYRFENRMKHATGPKLLNGHVYNGPVVNGYMENGYGEDHDNDLYSSC